MPNDTTDRLQMQWVPMTDSDGRTRMEAVWSTSAPETTYAPVHATTHAA